MNGRVAPKGDVCRNPPAMQSVEPAGSSSETRTTRVRGIPACQDRADVRSNAQRRGVPPMPKCGSLISIVLPNVGVGTVEEIAGGWQAELRQRQTELAAHALIARVG